MKNALQEATMNLSPDTLDDPTTTDTGGTDGPKTGGGTGSGTGSGTGDDPK